MPEWRKDPIQDRWVVIATERAKRPTDFRVPQDEKKGGDCPLCESHEWQTPPEVLAYRDKDSARDRPGWWIRVVPNKFPAVRVEGQAETRNLGLHRVMDGVGAHEVVVESPDHGMALEDLNNYQVQEVIRAWRDRLQDLRRDNRLKYIQIFKNFGNTAGASLDHPHSQIIATPMVPVEINRKMDGLTRYARATGRCILCEMIAQELQDLNRVVADNRGFVSIAPFASRFPFETWIIPREHQVDYGHIREDQVDDLARILRTTLKKLSVALNRPPYNLVISTAPANTESDDLLHFHWHLEILPRLTVAAGFELGTGYFINPTPPEIAASDLRDTAVVYDGQHLQKHEEVGKYV